jgi:hypothetical protein
VLAETARSRLTLLPCLREPRFVRRKVSGATPTLKEDLSNWVTVRQVPLMLMLSPRLQSPRISEALEMVRVVPPSSDWWLSSETTGHYQRSVLIEIWENIPPIISTIPVNIMRYDDYESS